MGSIVYVFKASKPSEEVVGLKPGDPISDFHAEEVAKRLGKILCLQFKGVPHIVPLSYEPTDADNERRRDFHLSDWHMVAVASTGENFASRVLLVCKRDLSFSLVLSLSPVRIVDEIHGDIAVMEFGETIPLIEYLEILGLETPKPETPQPSAATPKSPLPKAPAKENPPKPYRPEFSYHEEEEEEEPPVREVDLSAFQEPFQGYNPGKPKKISGDFSLPKPQKETSPKATPKAPAKGSYKPDYPEEEPPVRKVDLSAFQEPFHGYNPVKPKKISGDFSLPKPKKETPPKATPKAPVKPTPKPNPYEEEPPVREVDWTKFQSEFVPNSSKKPRLNSSSPASSFRFHVVPVCYWNSPNISYSFFSPIHSPERFAELAGEVKETLQKFSALLYDKNTLFAPRPPLPGSLFFSITKRLNLEELEVLALFANSMGKIESALLCSKSSRYLGFVVNLLGVAPRITSYFDDALFLPGRTADLSMIYQAIDRKIQEEKAPKEEPSPEVLEESIEEEPIQEEPVLEEPVLEEPALEEPEDSREEEAIRGTPQRRLFVSKKFHRLFKKFEAKFHEQARNDIEETYERFVFSPQEEFEKYLTLQDYKTLAGVDSAVRKIRFGTSKEYDGSRLFFVYGRDFEQRRIESRDIVLLYLTENGDHDVQGEIAREVESSLRDPDLLLDEILFPQEEDHPEEIAYPSIHQFSLLEEAKKKLPHIFLGSAGTGKTIVSFQNAFDGLDPNERILYLTYQSELRDYSKRILSSRFADNIDVFTFRDLCKALDLPGAKEMRDKGRFRRYIDEARKKNRSLRKDLSMLGGEFEDQCLTCYSFYRGIAEGLASVEDERKDIIGLEEFLEKTKKEQGFLLEQKKAIYRICAFYQDHLKRVGGTTDNRLAHDILLGKEKYQIYDRIIVDEFQDLTEIQFKAICSLLKPIRPLRLFLYGDDNQAINPTIFDSHDAAAIVSSFFPRATLHASRLNELYRCGNNLTHYINQVRAITTKSIGKRGGIIDIGKEENVRLDEDDVFVTLLQDPNRFLNLVPQALNSGKDVKFLFPSATMAEEYKKRFPQIEKEVLDSSFLSVGKIKGQECDTAILVNFFSSSSEIFDAMLGEEKAGKKSTLHRMLFNRYYVALTRAKNRVIVYESHATPLINKRLLSGLAPLDDGLPLEDYFGGKVDPHQWIEEGKRRYARRDYEGARSAFGRGKGDPEFESWLTRASLLAKAKNGDLPQEEAIAVFCRYEAYRDLLSYYENEQINSRYHLLLEILTGKAPFGELVNDALALLPKMGKEEAEAYFALLSQYFVKECERKEKPLWKKNK
ncbi:MAG: hypothetical protein SPI58_03540 [Candidatus Enteromonas sp.]|nr:hypothetical protein [Candidatus Enteromonas sp.]